MLGTVTKKWVSLLPQHNLAKSKAGRVGLVLLLFPLPKFDESALKRKR
jgi:hypothetical protein